MTLEEAIQTALDYEEKVRDVYIHARADAINDIGKRVFKALAKEEQGHVDYLYQKLAELQNTGRVTAGKLDSVIPAPAAIKAGVEKLENRLASDDRDTWAERFAGAMPISRPTSTPGQGTNAGWPACGCCRHARHRRFRSAGSTSLWTGATAPSSLPRKRRVASR